MTKLIADRRRTARATRDQVGRGRRARLSVFVRRSTSTQVIDDRKGETLASASRWKGFGASRPAPTSRWPSVGVGGRARDCESVTAVAFDRGGCSITADQGARCSAKPSQILTVDETHGTWRERDQTTDGEFTDKLVHINPWPRWSRRTTVRICCARGGGRSEGAVGHGKRAKCRTICKATIPPTI